MLHVVGFDTNPIAERVCPDHAQACRGGEGQAGGDEEEACVEHEEIERLLIFVRVPLALVDVFSIRWAGLA